MKITNQGRKLKKLLYSSDLEWMRPYVNKVKRIVPVHKLEKIVSLKASLDKLNRMYGQLVTETWEEKGYVNRRSRKYISLYVTYCETVTLKPFKRVIKPYSKIDLLTTLAHELAHLVYDDTHTTKHTKLENRICSLFMTMLENDGYISEEHELKHNKPKF